MLKILLVSCVCLTGAPQIAAAGNTDVVGVKVRASAAGFDFDVTLRHDDEGWEHYADIWKIVGPDGIVYDGRVLSHPHVNEQPFTRSLLGVKIPAYVKSVEIKAGAKPHGMGGKTMHVDLPVR